MEFTGHRSIDRKEGYTPDSWHAYKCGDCGHDVSGAVISSFEKKDGPIKWLLCTKCVDGSVLTRDGTIHPPTSFGPTVEGLPKQVIDAYEEGRKCHAVGAYTACELICRKILMHVAVDKGAQEGKGFAEYIDYLESNQYVTPSMKSWVNLIRVHGNVATHKLDSPDQSRAESTLMFTAELLRLIYEMESFANKYTKSSP
ncbi:MAG: DUF4145 domain-containing protein [Nitrososphaeraceae archaeon]|jgi:hypothetical protein